MKGNLFLKLEEKTSSKKTPKFLNVTLRHPILHTFDTAYAEN